MTVDAVGNRTVAEALRKIDYVVRKSCIPLLEANGIITLSQLQRADFKDLRAQGMDRDDILTLRHLLRNHEMNSL